MNGLEVLLNYLFQTYFLNQSYCTVFVSNNDFNFNFIIPVITIKSTLVGTNETSQGYSQFQKALLNSLDHGCDTFIVYNSNFQDFLQYYDNSSLLSIQRSGNRKFIFIVNYPDVDMMLINGILTSKLIKYIPDFIIIYPDDFISDNRNSSLFNDEQTESFDVQTYKIVTREMDDPRLIELDYWFTDNQSFLFNANLFPFKVKNLRKMPLNITTVPTYLPYVMLDGKLIKYDYQSMRLCRKLFF